MCIMLTCDAAQNFDAEEVGVRLQPPQLVAVVWLVARKWQGENGVGWGG